MTKPNPPSTIPVRTFKTAWFSKRAAAVGIPDIDLCRAAGELNAGQGDDLGGNVWKKRLDRNTKRGILVNKTDSFWVFVYMFAKSDRENIDDRELRDFRKLARDYGRAKPADFDLMVEARDLVEICNG